MSDPGREQQRGPLNGVAHAGRLVNGAILGSPSRVTPPRTRRREITLVVADDQEIVLAAFERLLAPEADIRVVARCLEASDVLDTVVSHHPDVLILDLGMPGLEAAALVREVTGRKLRTRVILLATLLEEELVKTVRYGASAVVLKDLAPRLLVRCIRTVNARGRWRQHGWPEAQRRTSPRAPAEIAELLSPRERDVAGAAAKGLRNHEIAGQLGISTGTVKLHLHTIYSKLKISGRSGLIIRFHQRPPR